MVILDVRASGVHVARTRMSSQDRLGLTFSKHLNHHEESKKEVMKCYLII